MGNQDMTLLEFLNDTLPDAWFYVAPETGAVVVTPTTHHTPIEVRTDGETIGEAKWFDLRLPGTEVWERWEMLDSWTFEGLARWLKKWEQNHQISIDDITP